MTTQEAIYKLENYDELEGKYNEALARIDEYERERAEVLVKIAITKKDIEKTGIISGALNSAIDMLKPPASEDEIKVGDIVQDKRDGETGIYVGMRQPNGKDRILAFRYDDNFFDAFLIAHTDNWIKTGKSCPQIAEILAELRGENDESSENSE